MPNPDPSAFGRTLSRLRSARDFTQQQVAARIPTYYSDAGAYGRIERGERHPDREAVIAIVVHGLLIQEVAKVQEVLQIAGYEALTQSEIALFGLTQVVPAQPAAPAPTVPSALIWRDPTSAGILIGSLVLAGLFSWSIPAHGSFALVASGLYALLYVVSLYLESSFDPEHLPSVRIAAISFALVLVSSTAWLAVDRALVDSGYAFALLFSLTLFLLSAILQFVLSRRALSESAIVTANFQTRTAQSAHLKNVSYFLLIVVLFWLPSFHCIVTLAREVGAGNGAWVTNTVAQDLMFGNGILALSVRWLMGLLLSVFLIGVYMGAHLLDNLRPHARLNSFTQLFYLRALLYFLLCLVCIGWFAHSLSELAP